MSRVISLDYCADQFVLKLLEKTQVAAVSVDARRDFSYMRDAAVDVPQVRAGAEYVLAMKPGVIVRSYGGGPNAANFYRRLDIPVVQIGYANSIEDVKKEIMNVAGALGVAEKGALLVAEMDQRLADIGLRTESKTVLYATPGGVTSGPGSLVDDLIRAAGLLNFQTEPGWRALPLETLTLRQPELLATAFYDERNLHSNFWSAARHPVLRDKLAGTSEVALDSATTACGGWFLVDAVEALAEAAPR